MGFTSFLFPFKSLIPLTKHALKIYQAIIYFDLYHSFGLENTLLGNLWSLIRFVGIAQLQNPLLSFYSLPFYSPFFSLTINNREDMEVYHVTLPHVTNHIIKVLRHHWISIVTGIGQRSGREQGIRENKGERERILRFHSFI